MLSALGVADLGLFCVAVLLLNATPGPDTAYIVGRTLAQGRAAGLVSAFGISAGCCLHAVALAFGLTAVLAASPLAFVVIKFAGAAYLAWLGARMLFARGAPPDGTSEVGRTDAGAAQVASTGAADAVAPQRTLPTIFLQALLTNLLNPKVILFFLAFFPQFVAAGGPHKRAALLLLDAVFVLMSTLWNSGTALAAGLLAAGAGRRPRLRRWLERSVGAAFIALGARLTFLKT